MENCRFWSEAAHPHPIFLGVPTHPGGQTVNLLHYQTKVLDLLLILVRAKFAFITFLNLLRYR